MTFHTLDGELALITHQSRRGLRHNLLNWKRRTPLRRARPSVGLRRLLSGVAAGPQPHDSVVPALRGYPYGTLD
jgi:hypothetical protein